MESYVKNYGSTERNRCFANRDGCSINWNKTLKALEILLKLDHIVKGNNIAQVWVGRDNLTNFTIIYCSRDKHFILTRLSVILAFSFGSENSLFWLISPSGLSFLSLFKLESDSFRWFFRMTIGRRSSWARLVSWRRARWRSMSQGSSFRLRKNSRTKMSW